MIAKNLFIDSIIPLKTSDTTKTAQEYMDEYKVSHLPVVNNIDYLGLVSEVDILSTSPDTYIGDIKLSLDKPFVYDYQHLFDVVKVISDYKLSLLPVTDKKNNYLGVIKNNNLIQNFSELLSVKNPGAVIILQLNINSYSLTEIASIVESNDAKVLNVFTKTFPDSTELEVTVKINKTDVYPVIQTFNRYNYIVKAYYSPENYKNGLFDRYDEFMNYLNI
ncbi:MAG: CBS domain-containing protein [Bacteroidales bacterium]|nr:CBS domain-containing protein [Bacteroidales bacterium]